MARILVAEDDVHVRELIHLVLSRAGHQVHTAGDGHEALELYRGGDYDLVCLDLDMPRLDGIGLTRAVRAEEEDGVPILLITASGTPADVAEAHAAGITAVMGKPFRPAHLREQVASLLGS